MTRDNGRRSGIGCEIEPQGSHGGGGYGSTRRSSGHIGG